MPDQEQQPAAPKPRRRQARGERRAAQLLDAAATVFTQVGYSGASTNAIAREAGVSPGTLYQFFPNKEAIAVELGGRLLEQWRAENGQALSNENLALPLAEMVDAMVDPLLAFNHHNPAFHVLMHGPDTPGQVTDAFHLFHGAVLTRIEEIIASYLPSSPKSEVSRVANMTLALFKAGLDLIAAHPDERVEYQRELKKVLFRYLDPLLCVSAPESPDSPPQQSP